MKHYCFELIIINFLFISWTTAVSDDDNWMNPEPWSPGDLSFGSLEGSKCCECSEHPNGEQSFKEQQRLVDDVASLIYFKKFIAMLSKRENFKYDATEHVYERSFTMTIKSSQMDLLEQLQDPRDLDSILTDIFNNIHTPDAHCFRNHKSQMFIPVIVNIFYDLLELIKIYEVRFVLVLAIIMLITWVIKNRFNIGWLSLIFGGIIIYGYVHTYLECNRELEVNQMLDILNFENEKASSEKGHNILTYIKDFFYSKEVQRLEEQKTNFRNSAKFSLGFCRPDHVLIIYFNDIFLKYLQVLLQQCTMTLTTLNDTLSFPYNMISAPVLICLIGYITKLTFKYILSPSVWSHYLHRKSQHATLKSRMNSQDDRISGDNLKLFLNAINTAEKRPTAVSGVEDVKEAVEKPISELLLQLDKKPTSDTMNNLKTNSPNQKCDAKAENVLKNSS